MRLGLKLIILPLLAVIVLSLFLAIYQVKRERRIQERELARRAELLSGSLEENVALALDSPQVLQPLTERLGTSEHLAGIAVYEQSGRVLAISSGIARRLPAPPFSLQRAVQMKAGAGEFVALAGEPVYIYSLPVMRNGEVAGGLAIVQDAAHIGRQDTHLWRYLIFGMLVQVVLILLTTLFIIRRNIVQPLARTAQWMRAIRMGASMNPAADSELFNPLTREVAHFAETLAAARASAELEAQLRVAGDSAWTPDRLSAYLRTKLAGSRLFVVANREPYMHIRNGKKVETCVPASGLVTALEPILCACDGTWIAHGGGNADRDMVDERDRVRVPPERELYALRRVWLSEEEERGYYYGFSNEGLWPLCHIAHVRPVFRASDWKSYRDVNLKFAQITLEEMEGTEQPVVIVQDYHLALLPRLIKEKRPDARVAVFWHIPWPNPEAFRICPWQNEVLDGLLGADLVGFHIQSHCNNFLETVERAVEARVDWEHFAVNRDEHLTSVRPFPISVVWDQSAVRDGANSSHIRQAALLRELGVEALFLGLGVDRVDYTKGILERFLGIERFLQKYPSYKEKLTFVQIGAPSRMHIKSYYDLMAEVAAEADRINWRFQTAKWKPIVFLGHHHTHQQIEPFYRAADFCLVSSLHDGMNLVAKEFVAARDDEEGVLLLSAFTGASSELRDALIVNPYDIEEMADAIYAALEMEPREKKARMRRMRRVVRENNVYRWAATLIGTLCDTDVEIRTRANEQIRTLTLVQ